MRSFNFSLLVFKRTEAGLEVCYDRDGEDKICVSAELMRDPSFTAVLPSLVENWGLEELAEITPWPGDKVYRVTKPDAEMITIKRS